MNSNDTLVECLTAEGNKKNILILQRHISHGTSHDTLNIHRNHLTYAVWLHAMEYSMYWESIFSQTTCAFNQRTNGTVRSTPIVHTRMEDCTFDLHSVCITFKNRVNSHRIAIHQFETTQVKLRNIMGRIMLARDTINLYAFLICLSIEASSILKQCSQTLTFAHFISHRTFYLTNNIHKTVIRTHYNHIIICQTDITRQIAIQDIIIHVDHCQLASTSVNLNTAECTHARDTASHIERMEHGREGRKRIGAWGCYLTHHIDHDGTGLTDSHLDVWTLIALS